MAIKPIEILIKARDEASGIFSSLQGKVAAVSAAIAGYFGISAFAGAVRGAADLEAKLSEVKAVSGATAAEMVQLRKAAEDAGASTKFTATESAEALGNLARAGLTAKDAIGALPAVLSLAQAGGIGLAEASDYVTKAVQGMGLKFTEAGRVADVLAMGANASNASVTGLAQALSYAAPVANSMGLSLESTVAIIGKFSDAGIDASRAGTALNAILSQFADPSSKFQQELANMGVLTTDFEVALRKMAEAGPDANRAILAVGTEAGPALRALLNQGIGALDDLKAKLSDAGGSAAATAAIMEDNLNGAFNSLSSAWDTVKNALATPVLPILKDGVTQLAESLRGAVSSGAIGRFGESIALAFQAGLKWAREFIAAIDFEALGLKLRVWAEQAGQAFTAIGQHATNAGNIVQLVYGVMSAGFNSIKSVVFTLAEAFSGVASNLQSLLAAVAEGLSKITFGGLSQAFKAAAEEIRTSAEATMAVSEAFAAKANEAFDAAAKGAELAQNGFTALANSATESSKQISAGELAVRSMADTLTELGKKAEESGKKTEDSANKQREAAEKAAASVAQLRTEYETAVNSKDWQTAAQRMAELEKANQGARVQIQLTREAIIAQGTALQAQMGLRQSSLQVAIEEQRAIAEVARARGNDAQVLQAQQQIRKLEIEMLRLTAEAKRAEAKSAIAAAEALRAELLARNDLTPVKKLEIEASIAAAKAKENEAKIADLTAEKLKALEEAANNSGKASSLSAKGYNDAAEGLNRIAEASERAAAAERKRLNVDKSGFTLDANGQRLTMGGQLTIPEGYYFDAEAANKDLRFRSGQSSGAEFIRKKPETIEKEEKERLAGLLEARKNDAGGFNGNAGYSPFGRAERTVTLNLNLNSVPQGTVQTDEQGADNLEKFLIKLQAAAARNGAG